jgi:hypothetical protein
MHPISEERTAANLHEVPSAREQGSMTDQVSCFTIRVQEVVGPVRNPDPIFPMDPTHITKVANNTTNIKIFPSDPLRKYPTNIPMDLRFITNLPNTTQCTNSHIYPLRCPPRECDPIDLMELIFTSHVANGRIWLNSLIRRLRR